MKVVSRIKQRSLQKPFQSQVADYVPDLDRFFSICEKNYILTQQVIELIGGEARVKKEYFGLQLNNDDVGIVECERIDQSRYTSTLLMQQIYPSTEWLPGTRFKVRLYHDANLAEVLEFQGSKQINPVYSYPNRVMHQCDEKQQHNQFYYEWLLFNVAYGCQLSDDALRHVDR